MSDAKPVRVALTFDYDAMSNWIGSSGAKSPGMISRGEFGPIGLHRILALLESRGIKSTFFVPGHTARAYPATVQAIEAAGHEIGHHGWVHENPVGLSHHQEKHVMEQGLLALKEVAGVRPVGYRSPGWDNSPNTVPLLVEFVDLRKVIRGPACEVHDALGDGRALQAGIGKILRNGVASRQKE